MNAFPIPLENLLLINDNNIVRTNCVPTSKIFSLTLAGAYANKSKVVCFENDFDCKINGLSRDSCKMIINYLYSNMRKKKQDVQKTSRK